jgi:hypothetical protein
MTSTQTRSDQGARVWHQFLAAHDKCYFGPSTRLAGYLACIRRSMPPVRSTEPEKMVGPAISSASDAICRAPPSAEAEKRFGQPISPASDTVCPAPRSAEAEKRVVPACPAPRSGEREKMVGSENDEWRCVGCGPGDEGTVICGMRWFERGRRAAHTRTVTVKGAGSDACELALVSGRCDW